MKELGLPTTGDAMIDAFLYIVGLALIGWIAYEIHWHRKYRKEYSEVKTDKGVVTDMDYTPPRTRYNAATKTTSTTPEEHDVFITFEVLGDEQFDDEELYQTVRLDDEVTAEYVEVWRVEKINPKKRVFMRNEIQTVISPKGRKVAL